MLQTPHRRRSRRGSVVKSMRRRQRRRRTVVRTSESNNQFNSGDNAFYSINTRRKGIYIGSKKKTGKKKKKSKGKIKKKSKGKKNMKGGMESTDSMAQRERIARLRRLELQGDHSDMAEPEQAPVGSSLPNTMEGRILALAEGTHARLGDNSYLKNLREMELFRNVAQEVRSLLQPLTEEHLSILGSYFQDYNNDPERNREHLWKAVDYLKDLFPETPNIKEIEHTLRHIPEDERDKIIEWISSQRDDSGDTIQFVKWSFIYLILLHMLNKYVVDSVIMGEKRGYPLELLRIQNRIKHESGAFKMGVGETMNRSLKSASLIVYPEL